MGFSLLFNIFSCCPFTYQTFVNASACPCDTVRSIVFAIHLPAAVGGSIGCDEKYVQRTLHIRTKLRIVLIFFYLSMFVIRSFAYFYK